MGTAVVSILGGVFTGGFFGALGGYLFSGYAEKVTQGFIDEKSFTGMAVVGGALVGAGGMAATAASAAVASRGITYLFSKNVGQPKRGFNSELLSRQAPLKPKLAKSAKPK